MTRFRPLILNLEGVTLLDVQPFVNILTYSGLQGEADLNCDGVVSLMGVSLSIC